MKLVIAALVVALAPSRVAADTVRPPEPVAFVSPSGQLVLRISPADSKVQAYPLAEVWHFDRDAAGFTRKVAFRLAERWYPWHACISDSGEIWAFANSIPAGIVWYGPDGGVKKKLALSDVFPPEEYRIITTERRSVSHIWWWEGSPYISGPYLMIRDPHGGMVRICDGDATYIPPAKPKLPTKAFLSIAIPSCLVGALSLFAIYGIFSMKKQK